MTRGLVREYPSDCGDEQYIKDFELAPRHPTKNTEA
jgi:hypothetical protein